MLDDVGVGKAGRGMAGVESGSWMALFRGGEKVLHQGPRFVGIAVLLRSQLTYPQTTRANFFN